MSDKNMYGEERHCISTNIIYRDPAIMVHLLVTVAAVNPERVLNILCYSIGEQPPPVPVLPTLREKAVWVAEYVLKDEMRIYMKARDAFWNSLQADFRISDTAVVVDTNELRRFCERLLDQFAARQTEIKGDSFTLNTTDVPDLFIRHSLWYTAWMASIINILSEKNTIGDFIIQIVDEVDGEFREKLTGGLTEISIFPEFPLNIESIEQVLAKNILSPSTPQTVKTALEFLEFVEKLLKIANLEETPVFDVINIGDSLVDSVSRSKTGSPLPASLLILPHDFPRVKEWTPNWIVCTTGLLKTSVVEYDLAVVETASGTTRNINPAELFGAGGVWLIPGDGIIVAPDSETGELRQQLITESQHAVGYFDKQEAIPIFISFPQDGMPECNNPPTSVSPSGGVLVRASNPALYNNRQRVFVDERGVVVPENTPGDIEEAYLLDDVLTPYVVYLIPRVKADGSLAVYPLHDTPCLHLSFGLTYSHKIRELNNNSAYDFISCLRELARSPEISLCVTLQDK